MKREAPTARVKEEKSSSLDGNINNNNEVTLQPAQKKVKKEFSSSDQQQQPVVISSTKLNKSNAATNNGSLNSAQIKAEKTPIASSSSSNNINNGSSSANDNNPNATTAAPSSTTNKPNNNLLNLINYNWTMVNFPNNNKNNTTNSTTNTSSSSNSNSAIPPATSSSTNANTNNNNNRIRIAYNPDDIQVYLIWRHVNDTSDDTKESNWKKVESTFIPSSSSSVHKQHMSHLAELNNSSVDSIRIGVMCKNKTHLNIALKFELDGKDYAFMSTTLKPGEDRLIRRLIHKVTKVSQTIQVKKNQVVENSSGATTEQSLIEKLGTVKVKVFRIQVASEQTATSSVATAQNSVKTPDIKIKEGMTKMKDLSVGFGATSKAQSFQQTGFAYKEEIKALEFVYHTRLGYLFELRKAGIDISNK